MLFHVDFKLKKVGVAALLIQLITCNQARCSRINRLIALTPTGVPLGHNSTIGPSNPAKVLGFVIRAYPEAEAVYV